MKNKFLFKILFVVLTLAMLLFPTVTFGAAVQGLGLWFNIVFPSLLPFFICIDVLVNLKILSLFSIVFNPIMKSLFKLPGISSFAFIMSIFSGYPVGAKITSDLLSTGQVSKSEAQRMLSLASTSGPLFVMSAVCVGMLGVGEYAFLMLTIHILSAISMGLVQRCFATTKNIKVTSMHTYASNITGTNTNLLGNAISKSITALLNVGGYIVFFSVIAKLIIHTGILSIFDAINPCITPLFVGLLEMTNGIQLLSATSVPMSQKLIFSSFLLAFGGLSINMQVKSFFGDSGLSFIKYLFGKFLQGLLAASYTFIALHVFGMIPTFSPIPASFHFNFTQLFLIQLCISGMILILSLLVSMVKFVRKFYA